MAKTKQLRKNQGFTLMELLIVVGILVILIAVSIPVFAGQIEKAKLSADLANIRSAKAAAFAEYLTTEPSKDIFYRYDAASGKVVTDPNAAQTIKGYGKSSKEVTGATGIPNVNGVARYLVVKIAVGGIMSASWGGTLGDEFVRDEVIEAFTTLKDENGNPININSIDSTAPRNSNANLNTMLKTLKENGLDMNALGAVSWKVLKSGDTTFLYFTQKDIAQYNVGDEVPIIRYNAKSKNYTVWTSKVTSLTNKYGTYKILSESITGYSPSTSSTNNNNQSYTKALEYYEELDNRI